MNLTNPFLRGFFEELTEKRASLAGLGKKLAAAAPAPGFALKTVAKVGLGAGLLGAGGGYYLATKDKKKE